MTSVHLDENSSSRMAATRPLQPHMMQVPTVPNANQHFVIDLDAAELGAARPEAENEEDTGPQNAARNAAVGAALPSLRAVLKPLEGTLPFILIVLFKVLYDHRLGILVFLAMFGTFFHANSSLRRLISLSETHSSSESVGNLLWLILFLIANIFCVYYVFDDQKLYRSLYLACPEVERVTLWVLLWVTLTTDFIVKFISMIIKALIALVPKLVLPLKKKGKWYMMIEILTQSYRCLLPITPWVYFLFEDELTGRWFSSILLIAYIGCKGYNLLTMGRILRTSFAKFRADTSYGNVPSRSQLESYENSCPICQDKFTSPVSLSCSHVFCEDCVTTWFNRERTCPMCRAKIIEAPQWRDGTTCTSLQIY